MSPVLELFSFECVWKLHCRLFVHGICDESAIRNVSGPLCIGIINSGHNTEWYYVMNLLLNSIHPCHFVCVRTQRKSKKCFPSGSGWSIWMNVALTFTNFGCVINIKQQHILTQKHSMNVNTHMHALTHIEHTHTHTQMLFTFERMQAHDQMILVHTIKWYETHLCGDVLKKGHKSAMKLMRTPCLCVIHFIGSNSGSVHVV